MQNTSTGVIDTIVSSLSRKMMILTAVSILLSNVIRAAILTTHVAERTASRRLAYARVLKEVTMYIYRETIFIIGHRDGCRILFGRVLR